ncbi:lipocalin family protein [Alteromonas facilis]|uniref:lipocalin family protein n=1 Tax=Alteromonas facilis TaxID=2048004 RepID=UPI000C28E02D|nr:lipocalin family protein [Alteromonas facilis]
MKIAKNSSVLKGLCCAILLFAVVGCTGVPEGVKPVTDFELNRYLGQWYEIARFDHPFEEGLEQVTATYSLREDGGVNVLNKGFDTEQQNWREATGKAYFVGEPSEGHLKVSFFGPFYASYVILALDKQDYRYSLVTGPDREYLWILSRTPVMPQEDINTLLGIAQQHGYDTEQFIWVEQKE